LWGILAWHFAGLCLASFSPAQSPAKRSELAATLNFLSFFLSLGWKTQANHWTKQMFSEHPINHLGPEKLSQTGGQGAFLFLEQTLGESPNLVGKTIHNVGGLSCILGLTNSHNQSP